MPKSILTLIFVLWILTGVKAFHAGTTRLSPPQRDAQAMGTGLDVDSWERTFARQKPKSVLHSGHSSLSANGVSMAYFEVDVTPPPGSPLAFGTTRMIRDSLSARGIVLIFDEKPVVLVAIDWIGIANKGMDVFRKALARAVGTSEDRVAIHALHQHNAVRCDLTTPCILEEFGSSELYYDTAFLYRSIENVASVAQASLENLQPVTDISFGQARVSRVASNRRILGRHGDVENMRWSWTQDFRLRHENEGVIDPFLKMITLFNGQEPLVSLSYYAVHPVINFGEGEVSAEFVGIARKYQEMKRNYPQIYFTGAAGNIGVGKYNNGTDQIRYTFAARLSMAMDEALESAVRKPLDQTGIKWKTSEVYLPLADYVNQDSLIQVITGEKYDPGYPYLRAIAGLAWWTRVHREPYVRISALHLGGVRLLSLPGEPFVEYQLAAQRLFPGNMVCTAAYEEYGMGYIGTRQAYEEGGYETSKMATMVGPEAEAALMKGIREVLE
ncbi:MAG TPA: hypothetical protein VKZ54_10300 [Membranihabitans sp.]|nr:hypothetical protein [Membranihabitans sp.]